MNNYLKQFDDCLQHEVSFCSAACPFNLDVNTFVARLQEGRFNAAYKTYRDATGFPFIAQRLCSEPCKEACLRNAVASIDACECGAAGDPIELLKLEEACLEYVKRKEPTSYNIPKKNKRIAIIGAGISGMACALRMATKKYDVTVYEKTERTGGMLLGLMDPEIIKEDFELQMQHLDYTIKFNTEIDSLEELIELGKKETIAVSESAQSAVASVMRSASLHANKPASETYDAIYVATGEGGNSFGYDLVRGYQANSESDFGEPCTMLGETAVFFGGSLTGADPVHALADGLRMATAIDNYTMTKILKYPIYSTTDIAIDETAMVTTKRISPCADSNASVNSDAPHDCELANKITDKKANYPSNIENIEKIYTKDEAIAEAKRCMKCQCNACRLHCDLTEYLHKWPLRLRDEVIATTAPGKSELHATPAVRTINMCTHCGLCKETCPESIDMDEFFQAARVRMHKLDKMPWAFNDFFLRDMEFTNGEAAYLCRNNPVKTTATGMSDEANITTYAFFPGCQLGASSPELVIKSYEYLLSIDRAAGIMLACCGIPAQWAGDEELLDSVTSRIREDWEKFGKPVIVLACPSCRKTFARLLPEIETVFIYELMAEHGFSGLMGEQSAGGSASDSQASEEVAVVMGEASSDCDTIEKLPYSVFDPCAAATDDPVRGAVRDICAKMGLELEALPVQERWTACCSYGGHGILADPAFTKSVRDKRIEESENPYITYCINCRDSFLHEGKEATHILNLIFDVKPDLETVTKRRENRIELKARLLREFWGESFIREMFLSLCDGIPSPDSYEKGENLNMVSTTNKYMLSGDSDKVTLLMSDAVRHKLSEEFILEQEAADVVEFCERTGRTLYDEEKRSHTGYRKIGHLTYWVEYRKLDSKFDGESECESHPDENGNLVAQANRYELLNAYTHRMEIELEMVWNGEKVEIDM